MREDFDVSVGLIWLARLIDSHTAEIRRDTERLSRKYDPNQPRVPRGQSTGGQWTDGGGGSGGSASQPTLSGQRLQDEINRSVNGGDRTARMRDLMTPATLGDANDFDRWWAGSSDTDVPGTSDPRLQDMARDINDRLDAIGAAQRDSREAIRDLAGMAAVTAAVGAVAYGPELAVMTRVIAGEAALSEVFTLSVERGARVLRGMKAIEEYLGGSGEVFYNKSGDPIFIRGNREVRFDINNPGKKLDGSPEDPHFQFEEITNTKWRSRGSQHRYPFRKE